jgi:hypothetical protein
MNLAFRACRAETVASIPVVVMPDEVAFQFVELHQLSIEFAGDVGFQWS